MNWLEVLKSIGWPTTVVTLDFESYWNSECTLDKLSYLEYINHPDFHLMGMGLYKSDDPIDGSIIISRYIWPNKLEYKLRKLQEEYGQDLEKCVVVGQNLMFDALILKEKFNILPRYTIDTLCLARMQDSRRRNKLNNLCKIYDLPTQKGDNKWTKGRTWDSLSDEEIKKLAVYGQRDIEATTQLFRKLLPMVSTPEHEIPLQDHTLKMYLIPRLTLDFELANKIQRGMRLELAKSLRKVGWVRKYKTKKHKTRINIIRSANFAKALKDTGIVIPMKQGKKGSIPALAKTDTGFQDLLNSDNETVRDLCFARLSAKSWPNWIKRIQSMINQAKVRDGDVGIPLLYHGAHTGRDSGTQNLNMQNLPGLGRAGEGTHPLMQQIRHTVRAKPGELLAASDLAQIEARFVAWYAGQMDLLNGFANGEDVYSQFATKLFQMPVRKPRKSDPPPVNKMLSIKRGFGKDAILGEGFGMGPIKFYDRCYSNPNLRPLFDSGEYNIHFIRKLVKTYRTMYNRIPIFWNTIECMFRWVTKYPNQTYGFSIERQEAKRNELICNEPGLNFWGEKGRTVIQLPSGRELYYPGARVGKDSSIKDAHGYWWGGSLTENVVQAAARDLFMEAVPKLEVAGFPVVLRSHDEQVCVVKKKGAEESLQKIMDIMCEIPAWAKGLPVAAEGYLSEHYKKG